MPNGNGRLETPKASEEIDSSRLDRMFEDRREEYADLNLAGRQLPEPRWLPGYVYRWIDVGKTGEENRDNYNAKLALGWRPVHISEQPHMDTARTPDNFWGQKGAIEIKGSLLCKIPLDRAEQIRASYMARQREQAMNVEKMAKANKTPGLQDVYSIDMPEAFPVGQRQSFSNVRR